MIVRKPPGKGAVPVRQQFDSITLTRFHRCFVLCDCAPAEYGPWTTNQPRRTKEGMALSAAALKRAAS